MDRGLEGYWGLGGYCLLPVDAPLVATGNEPSSVVGGVGRRVRGATSPHDPTNRLISKDRNNYPPVQTSRIDGHRPLFRGLCQGKTEL